MTLEGKDKLQRKMAMIPQKMLDAVRRQLEKEAQGVVDLMKRLAPVRKSGGGGTLRNSIGWTWGDAPAGTLTIGTVKAGGRSVDYGTMRITIYAGGGKAFYARFQEFGTKNMPANPFFYPAYRAKRKNAKANITRAMKKAVKDA